METGVGNTSNSVLGPEKAQANAPSIHFYKVRVNSFTNYILSVKAPWF